MGAVYRSTDAKLGREVAIKVLPDSFAQNRKRPVRIEREAWALPLHQPSQQRCHSPTWAPDGSLFFQEGGGPRAMTRVRIDFNADGSVAIGPNEPWLAHYAFWSQPGHAREYDVAPDCREILAVARNSSEAEAGPLQIIVVENWLEDLRRLVPSQGK